MPEVTTTEVESVSTPSGGVLLTDTTDTTGENPITDAACVLLTLGIERAKRDPEFRRAVLAGGIGALVAAGAYVAYQN